MEISAALKAVSSGSAMQKYVAIQMLDKAKDMQAAQMSVLLNDFAATQTNVRLDTGLGRYIDISV